MGGRVEGNKVGEWDNCNSIINKIYFLKKKDKNDLLNLVLHSSSGFNVRKHSQFSK